MVNYSTVALDLNNVIRGMNSKLVIYFHCTVSYLYPADFSLSHRTSNCLSSASTFLLANCCKQYANSSADLFLYGIRTLLYGLLAAGDPVSHTTGLRRIIRLNRPCSKVIHHCLARNTGQK